MIASHRRNLERNYLVVLFFLIHVVSFSSNSFKSLSFINLQLTSYIFPSFYSGPFISVLNFFLVLSLHTPFTFFLFFILSYSLNNFLFSANRIFLDVFCLLFSPFPNDTSCPNPSNQKRKKSRNAIPFAPVVYRIPCRRIL